MENEKKVEKSEEAKKEQDKFADAEKGVRLIFWVVVAVVHVLMYVPELFLEDILTLSEETITLQWWHVALFIQVVFNVVSLRSQDPDQVGAKLFYGKFLYQTEPGLVYVPLFLCEFMKESVLLNQWEIPGDLQKYGLYKPDEETIRMTTAPTPKGGDVETTSNDPLQTGRLTLNVKAIVQARLDSERGAFRQFVERVGTIANFLKITDDLSVNTISKEIARKSPSEVFEEWDAIETKVTELLQKRVGDFGFAELSVKAKQYDLPKRVNEALADRTAAHASVETERLAGEASKQKQILVADGVRAMEAAPIEGRINALRAAQHKNGLNFTQGQTLFLAYQDMIQKALKEANYTLLPSGQNGFMDPASMMSIMNEAVKVSNTQEANIERVKKTDNKKGSESDPKKKASESDEKLAEASKEDDGGDKK